MFVVYYIYLLLQFGRTALMLASLRGHEACVKRLLKSGARVNMWDEVSNTKAVKYLWLICVLVMGVTRESDK